MVQLANRRGRLIGAAVRLMLRQGYSATTVDQICATAEVTKGSFFHYFASKDQICRAAMDAWSESWQSILASAKFDEVADPLSRLFRLFDVMEAAYTRLENETGCMIGTVAQERALPDAAMRQEIDGHFDLWLAGTTDLLAAAKAAHPPRIDFDPVSVAEFMIGVVQGSMLVAKTRENREIIVNNLSHCRAYIECLFGGC